MTEYEITMNPEIREKYMERTEVLNKVKKLFLIPGMEVMTTKQVAEYFEVSTEVIQKVYQKNREEIDSDGTIFKKVADFRNEIVFEDCSDFEVDKNSSSKKDRRGVTTISLDNGKRVEIPNRGARCFSQRAILRIAMLLRDSVIAKEVRTQLLKSLTNNIANKTNEKEGIQNMDKSNIIKSFINQDFGEIRVVIVDEDVWFVGKDVASVLGYERENKAVTDHVDEEDRYMLTNETQSQFGIELGQRGGWLINESGLYSLIMSSKLESAKQFKRWVTSEVLPTLRKTGGYISNSDSFVETYFKDASPEIKGMFKASLDRIMELQNANSALTKENNSLSLTNKCLTKETLTWDKRKIVVAMIRSLAYRVYNNDYRKAYSDFYKELRYKKSICLSQREGGKTKLDTVREDEWDDLIQVATAMSEEHGIPVAEVINRENANVEV